MPDAQDHQWHSAGDLLSGHGPAIDGHAQVHRRHTRAVLSGLPMLAPDQVTLCVV